MTALPTLFLSHGSPMLALQESPARSFLQTLSAELPRPDAIVVVSAHWESVAAPIVSLAERPPTIHDFGGFPDALFALQYPAPGAPALAERIVSLLEQDGHTVERDMHRGLDHGAWVPLRLMYPEADVPVTQLSIIRGGGPAAHARLGEALAGLRRENVLVIGSGSLTHNLYAFRGQDIDAPAADWVTMFEVWMKTMLETGQREALLDYRQQAPHAVRNHPTEEHLLPLFVAMGAAGSAPRARRLHTSVEYGVLAMDAYAFD